MLTATSQMTLRSERQHVPLDKYARLLRYTVRHVAEAGANATVIITPPPIDEAARVKSRKEVSARAPAHQRPLV